MASTLDIKLVIKHLVNGTLGEKLCRICLLPLNNFCENIFTKVCKEEQEYCIADVLEQICHIKFSETDYYNVCSDCFITASAAYKFYLFSKRSEEILNLYMTALAQNVNMIDMAEEVSADSVCISLPKYEPVTKSFNFDLEGLSLHYQKDGNYNCDSDNSLKNSIKKPITKYESGVKLKKEMDVDDDIVIIMQEDNNRFFFKPQEDGTLVEVNGAEKTNYHKALKKSKKDGVKIRRKRHPMSYKACSKCPVKYRFTAKLKEHMKTEHNIDLHICKVCKAIMEDEQEFHSHLQMHTNSHTCAICNMVFKRRETIIAHIQRHEEMKNMSLQEGAHVCEICGQVLQSEQHLNEHYDKKHDKKYTCYYCGRMYKGELSFEMHVKKHEKYMKEQDKNQNLVSQGIQSADKEKKRKKTRQKIHLYHLWPQLRRRTCPYVAQQVAYE